DSIAALVSKDGTVDRATVRSSGAPSSIGTSSYPRQRVLSVALIAVALIVAVVVFAASRISNQPIAANSGAPSNDPEDTRTRTVVQFPDRPAIAVLPFENRSDD